MIDQLVSGAPQAQQPVKASQGGKQQAADQDADTSSFDDMVSKAGQQQSRNDRQKGGKADDAVEAGPDASRLTDGLSKIGSDISAILRGLGSASDGRIKLSNFKDALKAADIKDQPADQQEAIIAKLFEKLKQAAAAQAQKLEDEDKMAVGSQVELSPADELGQLLGLVAKEADPKAEKKSADTDKTVSEDSDDQTSALDIVAAKVEAKAADQTLQAAIDGKAVADAPRQKDEPRDETVRVVSADGRGRAVDISVSKTGTDSAKDTDKTATPARIDTATVLEARRYLGFTPDTNATALATAAKADPTWSSALQAVQRVEAVTTLANTVSEVNTLKLQMNPENLGNMVASLKLKDDVLTVEVRVDSVEAYRHLSADHDDIVKALQDQGFSIDKVTVQLNATERTDTGTDRDMARQQGQAQREGQGSQSGRNDGRSPGQPSWTPEHEAVDVAAGDSRAGTRESGNIYL